MSKPVINSIVVDDGLRYKAKAKGTMFPAMPFTGRSTMSCFLCGKHKPQSELMFRKLIGKSHAVCSPKC